VAVFSGMLGVTFFGLLLTPVFYVVLQGLVERRTQLARQFALQPAHDEDSKHA
jgi:multidrug efflux pump